jgi:hypothetical protein
MEKDTQGSNDQSDAAAGNGKPEEARPGRPQHHVGRRRLLAGGLAVGPVLLTLGSMHRVAAAPNANPCHSNSLSRLASFHPGTHCPNTGGGGGGR